MTTTPGFEMSSDPGVGFPSAASASAAGSPAGDATSGGPPTGGPGDGGSPTGGLPLSAASSSAAGPSPAGPVRPAAPDDPRSAPLGRKALRLLVLALPLFALVGVLSLDVVACPFKAMSGVPCPGCGLTRATLAIVTGDLHAALHYNPLVFVLTPTLVFVVLRSMLIGAGFLDPGAWQVRLPAWVVWPSVALLTGVWLARLLGFLGGHPDGIHLERSWIGRLLDWLGVI